MSVVRLLAFLRRINPSHPGFTPSTKRAASSTLSEADGLICG